MTMAMKMAEISDFLDMPTLLRSVLSLNAYVALSNLSVMKIPQLREIYLKLELSLICN